MQRGLQYSAPRRGVLFSSGDSRSGFTLIEVLLGGVVLAIAAAAILGAYVGQVTLNEHARNLSLAVQDANRIIEQLRQQNASCGVNPPSASWPAVTAACTNPGTATTSWDDWLQRCGGLKSLRPDPANNEFVAVTCQDAGATVTAACNAIAANPIRVTVAVCWRHRGRIIGECKNNGAALIGDDTLAYPGTDTASVIDSPAMLTTLVTCRG